MIDLSRVENYILSKTIANGESETIILFPNKKVVNGVTCTLIAGINTGKFQYTTSTIAEINAGTATYQDWALGENSGTVSDAIISPVTALKAVSVTGEIKIEVVIL